MNYNVCKANCISSEFFLTSNDHKNINKKVHSCARRTDRLLGIRIERLFRQLRKGINMLTVTTNAESKRYLYGPADEKFVKIESRKPKPGPLTSFKFRSNPQVEGKTDVKAFNRRDVPLVFKYSPDTLMNLCLLILDGFPLPEVYKWSIEEICKWLTELGFKHYQNTFRVNLINGRRLLLLDASALVAMNIRDFNHIKQITRGIRDLFFYEMTKFGRSLSLYPEYHHELYKLVRLKTGAKYNVERSAVWRKMQLIRQNAPNCTHWELLEEWLGMVKRPQCKELVGVTQSSIIKTSEMLESFMPATGQQPCEHCPCLPPCNCHTNVIDFRPPWHLKCLPHLKPDQEFVELCDSCNPICNCRWSYKKYHIRGVLTSLKEAFPNRYGRYNSRRSEQLARASVDPKILSKP